MLDGHVAGDRGQTTHMVDPPVPARGLLHAGRAGLAIGFIGAQRPLGCIGSGR